MTETALMSSYARYANQHGVDLCYWSELRNQVFKYSISYVCFEFVFLVIGYCLLFGIC